jgi:4-alpha-glucanotransferase
MGLLRLFWIPEGRPGRDGAYVSYRADELLGILALESRRHRAAVVAEDLGTLPPELPGLLNDWGLLRSSVVVFARDEGGGFRPSADYPERAMATVATHDLAPFAGYWSGNDIALRHRLGCLDSGQALEAARTARHEERRALVQRLQLEGLLPDGEDPAPVEVLIALHAFLARTPSVLVAASLDDIAGETEPVNVPGVSLERHLSWSRRMRHSLDELSGAPDVARALEALRRERQPPDGRDRIGRGVE